MIIPSGLIHESNRRGGIETIGLMSAARIPDKYLTMNIRVRGEGRITGRARPIRVPVDTVETWPVNVVPAHIPVAQSTKEALLAFEDRTRRPDSVVQQLEIGDAIDLEPQHRGPE